MLQTRAKAALVAGAIVTALSGGCKPDRSGHRRESNTSSPLTQAEPALPKGFVTGETLRQRIATTKAKCVLVNAWASWCGSCRHEMPMLLDVTARLGREAVELIVVSVDQRETHEKARDFLSALSEPPESYFVFGRLGPFKQAMTAKWKGVMPSTFLFDPSGKLRYFWQGEVYEKELTPILEGFLAGEAIDGESNFSLSQGKTVQ